MEKYVEISGAIIVQVTRLESGLHIRGLDYRHRQDRDATLPFLLMEGVVHSDKVFKSFSFQRKPAGQHWFSFPYLSDNRHVKVDKGDHAQKFRLMLDIPVRDEMPFVDFIPCGNLIREVDGKRYIVFMIHTNAIVQPTEHDRVFSTIKGMDFLHNEPGLYHLIDDAIEKHGIKTTQ